MNKNQLLWIVAGILFVMQIIILVTLYQSMVQPKQIITKEKQQTTSVVTLSNIKNESLSDTVYTDTPQETADIGNIKEENDDVYTDIPQEPVEPLTAGSAIKYKQGSVDSYANRVLLFTNRFGEEERAYISTDTKIIRATGAKPQDQFDAEMDKYVTQLETLIAEGEQNTAKINMFESPVPYIEESMSSNDLKEGDNVSVVYISTKSDGAYDAIRVVLLPQRR